MLTRLSLFLILFSANALVAQTVRVAILDFENISGIAKYDGLGKAMSSMLITDIEVNVSPKRMQLVERAQIQKILKEQNFQSSAAVDKSTAVKAGQIFGVKYLLIGDIYILDDVLVINARLTDTETGDIKFSKKQEGKISTWLMLKTNIAKELASSMSMPFTDPNIPDKEINVATITTFGNALVATDEGKFEKAEILLNTVAEFSPDFKYSDDLKVQLDLLKKQVEKNMASIQILESSGGRIINPVGYGELKNNLQNGLTPNKDQIEYLIKLFENYPVETEQNINALSNYPTINSLEYSDESFMKDVMIIKDMMSRSLNKRICSKYAVERLKVLSQFIVSPDFGYSPNVYKNIPVEKRMPKITEVTRQLRELIVSLEIDELEKSKLGLNLSYDLLRAFVSELKMWAEPTVLRNLYNIDSFNKIYSEIRRYSSRLYIEDNRWLNSVFDEINNARELDTYVRWLVEYTNNGQRFNGTHEFTRVLRTIFFSKLNTKGDFYVIDLGDDYSVKKLFLNSLFLIDDSGIPKVDEGEFQKYFLDGPIVESQFYAHLISSVVETYGAEIYRNYHLHQRKILLFYDFLADSHQIICLF